MEQIVSFETVASVIRNHSEFIWRQVCDAVVKGNALHVAQIHGDEVAGVQLVAECLDYIRSVSPSDADAIAEKVDALNVRNEVAEHFARDEDSLLLEQQFDAYLQSRESGWAFEDKLEMYRNEY